MSDDNVTPLPTGDIDFDLDSAVKDPKDIYSTFHANVRGKRIAFKNPDEVDWQDLAYLEGPVELLQYLVSRDDLRHIREADPKIEGWQLGKLMEAVTRHYGWDEKFVRAQREAKQAQRGLV